MTIGGLGHAGEPGPLSAPADRSAEAPRPRSVPAAASPRAMVAAPRELADDRRADGRADRIARTMSEHRCPRPCRPARPGEQPGRAGALLPLADRQPARRDGPHRAVQLGVRPAHRRDVRVPHRGHRHARATRRRPTSSCSTRWRWLGLDWDEGERSAARTARTGSRSGWTSTPRSAARPAGRRARLPVLLHPRGARGAPRAGAPRGPHARLRRALPRADRRAVAAYAAEGRRPALRFRMPGTELTWDDLVRGPVTLRRRARAGLRPRARQRRAAVHAGQPGRRRAHADHPRAARRGPAVQHAPPAGALRRAGARSASPTARSRGSATCRT